MFDLLDIGLVSADLTDLWTGTDLGTVNTAYTAPVDAHGALVYKLSNWVQAPPCNYTTYLATASSNTLAGGAAPRALNDTASVVSNIGHGGTLTFVGVDGGASGGTKLLSLSYVNADYTFSNTKCSNCRRAEVSVNGGKPVVLETPISGQVRVWPGFLQRCTY
jgi:alpha-galactosidase